MLVFNKNKQDMLLLLLHSGSLVIRLWFLTVLGEIKMLKNIIPLFNNKHKNGKRKESISLIIECDVWTPFYCTFAQHRCINRTAYVLHFMCSCERNLKENPSDSRTWISAPISTMPPSQVMNCCGGTANAAALTSIHFVRSIQGKMSTRPGLNVIKCFFLCVTDTHGK